MQCTVFYSWQRSLPNPTNRGFIQAELEAAAKELKTNDEISVEPVIDRDTLGVPGAPDIGVTILAKIDDAAAFVCDVSIINSSAPEEERRTPNPNVLIELGYALKALGWERLVMVMNTAFGRPEDLPFDLRQKRVLTYELPQGADKAAARRELRGKLVEALKPILLNHEKAATAAAAASTPAPADAALEAIRSARPDQEFATKRFMESLVQDLAKLDPHAAPGNQAENLVKAVESTRPLVDDFGRVAKTAAEMNATGALLGLLRGLESVLARHDLPPGFAGPFSDTDFDLFKFVGHEVCAVLFAHLIGAGRWSLIRELASQQLYVEDRYGQRHVGVDALSAPVKLLAIRGQQIGRVSVHADLLEERHSSIPVGGVPLVDFLGADLILFFCFSTFTPDKGGFEIWYPWSAPYFRGRTPRVLNDAKTSAGARNLSAALGIEVTALRPRIKAALDWLNKELRNYGRPGLFDADQIATS